MYIDYLSNSRTNGMNTGREYLTMEELAAIIKREFDSSRLEKVRDLYLFACYTGLVYQDIKNLQPYNIITAKDGTRWLSIRRQMHSSSWQIPLLENACQIIDKYKAGNLPPIRSALFYRLLPFGWRKRCTSVPFSYVQFLNRSLFNSLSQYFLISLRHPFPVSV